MVDDTASQDGVVKVALPMIGEILADLARAVEDTEARLARLQRIAPEEKKADNPDNTFTQPLVLSVAALAVRAIA